MRFFTGSRIIPVNGDLPHQAILVFDGDTLVDITTPDHVPEQRVETFQGTLIPGFVNAHCHLELSYMKGKIETETGLTHFLQSVVTHPVVAEEDILAAIESADQEMWESGIVAVGDISNRPVTIHTKLNSRITYYTFVEMFDFLHPQHADPYFDQYHRVFKRFVESGLSHVTQVPHSPYTVSNQLSVKLAETIKPGETGSIHMLESDEEVKLLTGNSSEYYDFFKSVGYELDHYDPPGYGSMEWFLHSGYRPSRMLFVHNTIAQEKDLALMKKYKAYGQPWLVTCPNANLYIESCLPDYGSWVKSGIPICIGTDSYSSNHQLSIWNEICTIKTGFKEITWGELIRWATLHGAQALGMEERFGSLEIGKRPGLVLLEHHPDSRIDHHTAVRRIL